MKEYEILNTLTMEGKICMNILPLQSIDQVPVPPKMY